MSIRSHRLPPEEWVEDQQGKHLCACGCEKEIPINIEHYKKSHGVPDYILGHNSRGNGNPSYKGVDKWLKENLGKIKCACGCGESISLSKHHHYDPKIYIHGHNARGEKNNNWQGGISKYDKTRNSHGIRKWRKEVLKRDDFRCQMPGCLNPTNQNLCAHHIVPISVMESLKFDIDNGITLCRPCHSPIRSHEAKYEIYFQAIVEAQKVR